MSAKIRRVCAKRVKADLTRFLQLVDTPDTYEGQAGKLVAVKAGEDGVEFVNAAGLNIEFLDDQTVYTCPSTTDIRDAVHITAAGVVATASKDDTANLPVIGLVVAKPTSTSCIIQTLGYLEGFTGLVEGETYYLDTDGKITNTATTVSGEALYVIGVAKSSSKLELRIGSATASPIFGQGAQDFINTTPVNFSSSALVLVRSFTTTSKSTGRYRIATEVTFKAHSTSENVRFELRVNGTAIGTLYDNEHKDNHSDIREKVNLLGYYNHTGPATFNIEIWASRQSGGAATLHNVIAETWRVS